MKLPVIFVAIGGLAASPAYAQEVYVSGSIGLNAQSDSDNEGEFTDAFNVGNSDGALPTGAELPAGTPVGWTTELDDGIALSGEIGVKFDNGFRVGLEYAYTESDVNTHRGVFAGDTVIDDLDVSVLTGDAELTGATVGQIVGDGQGSINNNTIFLNAYYDFDLGSTFEPYVGGGIGLADVDVVYVPSGVGIVDDSESKFAYQLIAGANLKISEKSSIFAQYSYRETSDVDVAVDLIPARLDIENQQSIFAIGFKQAF